MNCHTGTWDKSCQHHPPDTNACLWSVLSILSQRRIHEFHSQNENSRLDWKSQYNLGSDSEKAKLAKDVCAIANFLYQNSGHGHLVIGTDDNGSPIGIDLGDYGETRLQQIVSSWTNPPPVFNVHHVMYRSVNLAIIAVKRNPAGPHQLIKHGKAAGFPIRRGSTNDMMTVNEVFQAMQARGRSFDRQRSEYETLSPEARYRRLINDCMEALFEIGISQDSVERIEYGGRHSRYGGFRAFIKGVRTINSRRWNLYCSVESQSASRQDLFYLDSSIMNLRENIPLHRSIFIHIVHGTIGSSYYTSRQRILSPRYIKVPIEPRITYFGLGEGISESMRGDPYFLPKFFVSHIKSKDDIRMRIELILNWIEQHREMFEDIREALRS